MIEEQDTFGAVKVIDALFLGNEFGSKDLEFIVTNKITHFVNASARQLTNQWESLGLQYLPINWLDMEQQVLFDSSLDLVDRIYKFILGAINSGEAVLVFSLRGQSRACCVLCAYFMRKYKWPLHKALEFLNTRRPNLEIRASFYEQLRVLEENILRNPQYKFRFPGPSEEIKSEETMVSNTFENARAFVLAPKLLPSMEPQIKNHPKIKWADESPNTEKHQLVEAIMETLLDPQNKTKDSKKDAKTPQKSSIKKSSLSFKKENEPSILERKKENPTESPKKQPQNNSFIAAEYFFPFLPSWESRKQELKNNGRK